MKNATIIRDKISGQPFAILLPTNGEKLIAFGSVGQGELWAEWAMASSTGMLDNLDVSLAVEKDVELTDEFINSLDKTFSASKINDLKFAISKKAILVIQQTKSLQNNDSPQNNNSSEYEQINEENEKEKISNWPIVDVAIATIDVAYKQAALDYKAKAFNLDSQRSSILLQVKGVRAMWDPNMPGGGGWRCPDNTPYGGQFTNRLGRGCTFGAIRRIGRALMTASLKDIAKGFDNDEAAFPSVYRAGKKLDEVGDKLRKQTGQKYAKRAVRRANQLKKEKARQDLKESRPTFRQRYESLGPTVSRRNRVLIAAAQTARDVADDQVTRAFVSEGRRANRRQGLPTPKDKNISRSRNSRDGDSPISGRMSADNKAKLEQLIQDHILEKRGWKKEESILFNPDVDDMSNVGNLSWPGSVDTQHLTSVSRYRRGSFTAEVFTQRYSKQNPREGIRVLRVTDDETGEVRDLEHNAEVPLDEMLYMMENRLLANSAGDLPLSESALENDAEIERRWRQQEIDKGDVTVSVAPGDLTIRKNPKPLTWNERKYVDWQGNTQVIHETVGNNSVRSSGDSIYTIREDKDNVGFTADAITVDAIHGYNYARDGGQDYDEEYFDVEFASLDEAKAFVQRVDDSRYDPNDDDYYPNYPISGAMSSKRREQIAEKLRGTAQNILEGRRFFRRQKRSKNNSPYLSADEIETTERLIGGQIDSILEILEGDQRGRQYIADTVNAMNESIKPYLPGRGYLGSISILLYELTGVPGIPNPDYPVKSNEKYLPYSASDFGLEDLFTFRAALKALKTGRPFQEQNWGKFSQLFKLYSLTRANFDPGTTVRTNTKRLTDDIPVLAIPQVIATNQAPGVRLPELWVDSPMVGDRSATSWDQNPIIKPLFANRPLEEIEELNNLYATIGLLSMDARGNTPHTRATLFPDDVEGIGSIYAAKLPESVISQGSYETGDTMAYALDRKRAMFTSYYREYLAGSRKFNDSSASSLANGLIQAHKDDLRIFVHNLWHGRTQWRSAKKESNNDDIVNKRNSIVERFIRGLSPSRDKQSGSVQRELRGRVPRSTTRLRERIAMRSRRKARIQAGEIQSFDDAPKFEQPKINRPESPGGPRKLREFLESLPQHGTVARTRERWSTSSEDGIVLTDETGRQKVDPILRDFTDHIQPDGSDSATAAAIRNADWANPENAQNSIVNTAGLDDLDRFFRDEVNHAAIARLREGALTPYDLEHQDELRRIYNDWLMSFNDPEEDPSPGSPSNMRLTEMTTKPWVMRGEPGFLQEDMDEAWRKALRDTTIAVPIQQSMTPIGERIVLRAATPSRPVVYIEDSEAQVAHLMTPEGKHLMSMVTTRPDENGKSELFFIAGSDALRQIEEKNLSQKLSQRIRRLSPRERRRTAALNRPQSKRRNPLAIDSAADGTDFGKTSTGLQLAPNVQAAMDKETLDQLVKSIDDNLDILENNIRRELDFPDTKRPISTTEAVARIAEIKKTSPRRAAIIETDLHNMVALARAQESGDINYINDLKPGLRNRMLENLGSEFRVNRHPRTRYDVIPHEILRGRRPLPKRTKIPGRSPVIVSESTLAPEPPRTSTGPELTPGVGNPQLGIEYEKLSGLYIDTATGEYIEDYSGLPIEQTAIFEPIPPQEGINYPRVIVSPPGILPSKFATLAPGTNPDNSVRPGDTHTPTFREAINAFTQSLLGRKKKKTQAEQVVQNILGRDDVSPKLRGSLLAMIDARGWRAQIPGMERDLLEDPYFDHNLGLMQLDEIQGLANQSVEQNPNLPLVDLGISYTDVYSNTQLNSTRGSHLFAQQFANSSSSWVDGLGLDMGLEPGVFYLPGENVNGNFINDEFLVSINRALQLQHAADSLSAKLSGRKFTDDLNDPTGTSDYINTKEIELSQLRADATQAWIKAAEVLSDTYADASRARNAAADILSQNPKNAKAMEEFLRYGAQAEAAKMLLDRHITSNPIALDALQESSRAKLQALAKQRNARKRMQLERAKARAGRAIPRNEGAFDNNPEILDPHGTANAPTRSLDEVFDTLAQHRSEGLFDDPVLGITQLTDEQITALAQLQELQKKWEAARRGEGDGSTPRMFTGIEGTPLYGVDFNTANANGNDVIDDVQVAHFWFVNGSSSLPVLISEEELKKIVTELDSNGNRRAVPIARGVNGVSRAQEEEWVNMALRGDRFVPGQGGKASGHGEYWALQPRTWRSSHGEAGTMLGVITEKTQIFSRHAFYSFFPTQSGPLYETMWGLYNAIGAPDSQGVNTRHGQGVATLLPPNSLLPDPKTGQFSPAQIAQLEDAVAKLTAVGSDVTATRQNQRADWRILVGPEWGLLTVEGIRRGIPGGVDRDGLFGRALLEQTFMDKIIKPDTAKNVEIIEETQALRQRINSWYAQHLSWFVQLAQMRQDESLPGQAGIDAKAYNKKLNSTMRSILYMKSESRASMLGVDVMVDDLSVELLPSLLWDRISSLDSPEGDRVLVLNRSGMIYLRNGLRGYESAKRILENLKISRPGQDDVSPINERSW